MEENDKKNEEISNDKILVKIDDSFAIVKQMKDINAMVDWIADSNLGIPFQDKDGKVNKSDIVANIIMGHELGLSPLGSIAYGKKLGIKSYMAVIKGKTLGVDPVTAMNKIYTIPNKSGDMIVTGVDIILKVMIDNGVTWEIIENYSPVYNYYHGTRIMSEEEYLEDGKLKSKFILIFPSTNASELKAITDSGKIPVTKKETTKRTTIKFTRKSIGIINYLSSYTLQQATDAGLYKGFLTDKEDGKAIYIEGKDNWNKYPETMLINRVFSNVGRKIVGDKLNGVYDVSEIPADVKTVDTEYIEV
jgi:hypothetical protein